MTRGIVALVFRCKITGGDLTTTGEASAFHWVTDGEIADLTDEAYAVRVLDALDDDHLPAVRPHDGAHLMDHGYTSIRAESPSSQAHT